MKNGIQEKLVVKKNPLPRLVGGEGFKWANSNYFIE